MTTRTHEPPTMTTEGAELRLGGGPFPPGTAEHVCAMLAALHKKANSPKVLKAQELDEIPDVVVQSAFVLAEDDLAAAEEQFEKRTAVIQAAGGVIPEQDRKVAKAELTIADMYEAANSAGIRFTLQLGE